MSIDTMLSFALAHYVIVGLVMLCVGIALNLVFTCGPELIQAIRHPRLN